jgi:hypothetical protein
MSPQGELDQSAFGKRSRRSIADNHMVEDAYIDQGQRAFQSFRDT